MSGQIQAFISRRGGKGGTTLETLTTPAAAADILSGKEAYADDGTKIVGTMVITDVHPSLNAVTIAKSNNTLTLTNPSTNGNFLSVFKIYDDGSIVATTASSPYDLLQLPHKQYVITAKASNSDAGFQDSAASNSVTLTVYLMTPNFINLNSSAELGKITNGMTVAFTLTPKTGYYLPSVVDIRCNNKPLDFTYNPYTGEVSISALALVYAAASGDGSDLPVPAIMLEGYSGFDYLDATTSGRILVSAPKATKLEFYADDSSEGTENIPYEDEEIQLCAIAPSTPALLAPKISLSGDNITIVDGFLEAGDAFYAEYYDIYSDGIVVAQNEDATTDQHALISYEFDPSAQFSKQSDGSYQTATSSSYKNTYAWMRAKILAPKEVTIKVSYTFYPYNSYVRMYAGKLDRPFTKSVSTTPSSSDYQVASSGTSTATSYYTITVPAGSHFIDFIKQYNSTSTSSTYYQRYMKIKVEEVTE